MKKDSKYAFRVNKEVKDKFKMYCKIVGVSPSDVISDVMIEFNGSIDKILEMKTIEEFQSMVKGQYEFVQSEIDRISNHPTFKK